MRERNSTACVCFRPRLLPQLATCNTLAFLPGRASRRSFGSILALCVSRARREELATLSSTGDGGTGEASLGRGLDGATELSEGLPVGRRRWTAGAGAGGSCT